MRVRTQSFIFSIHKKIMGLKRLTVNKCCSNVHAPSRFLPAIVTDYFKVVQLCDIYVRFLSNDQPLYLVLRRIQNNEKGANTGLMILARM